MAYTLPVSIEVGPTDDGEMIYASLASLDTSDGRIEPLSGFTDNGPLTELDPIKTVDGVVLGRKYSGTIASVANSFGQDGLGRVVFHKTAVGSGADFSATTVLGTADVSPDIAGTSSITSVPDLSGAIVSAAQVYDELGIPTTQTTEEQTLTARMIIRAEGAVRRYLGYNPVRASRTEYYPMKNYGLGMGGVWEANATQAYLRELVTEVSSELQLKHIPIRSMTSVAIDYDGRSDSGSGAFTDTKTEGTDYWPNYDGIDADSAQFCSDGILRSIGTWPSTPGSIKVVYTAGYSSSEFQGQDDAIDGSPIWETTLVEVARRVKGVLATKKSSALGFVAGVIEAERMGDYNYKVGAKTAERLFGGLYDLLPESQERLSDFVNYGWRLEG